MRTKPWASAALLTLLTLPAARAGDDGWIQDFEAAKAQAKAEGKDLLIDFTGSDWCIWCKRLHNEVFSQEPFQAQAPNDFVLVKLDFPRDESLVTPEIKAQNEALKDRFAIQGFPTVFLADADGLPYAQTGYQPGGAEKYLAHLADLKEKKAQRDELFRRARAAEGAERAKLLDEALSEFEDGVVVGCYGDVIDEIVAADAQDEAGLRTKYTQMRTLAELDDTLNRLASAGDWAGLSDAMEKIAEAHPNEPKVRQTAIYFQAFGHVRRGNLDEALALLRDAQKIDGDPRLGKQISLVIQQVEQALDEGGGAAEGEEEGSAGGGG